MKSNAVISSTTTNNLLKNNFGVLGQREREIDKKNISIEMHDDGKKKEKEEKKEEMQKIPKYTYAQDMDTYLNDIENGAAYEKYSLIIREEGDVVYKITPNIFSAAALMPTLNVPVTVSWGEFLLINFLLFGPLHIAAVFTTMLQAGAIFYVLSLSLSHTHTHTNTHTHTHIQIHTYT